MITGGPRGLGSPAGNASSRLFEGLELLGIGILGKRALWRALREVATRYPPINRLSLDALEARADDQYSRVSNGCACARRTAPSTRGDAKRRREGPVQDSHPFSSAVFSAYDLRRPLRRSASRHSNPMPIPTAIPTGPLRALTGRLGGRTDCAGAPMGAVVVLWRRRQSPAGRRGRGIASNSSGCAARDPTRCAKTQVNSAPSKKIWAE
jgi:hypothetical protein